MSSTEVMFPEALAARSVPRLLSLRSPDLRTHSAHFGPVPTSGPELIGEVDRAGLRGRGGAGFPTAVKMAAVARGRRTVVGVNGTEGEPASAKDKTLLRHSPHLVLDGAAAAAAAVGAGEVVVCVERSAATVLRAVEVALHERADRLPVRLAATPSRYVAGEESALVRWLNGGEAKPTFTPPRPFERGVGGRPTLVDNAETLAHVALIARFGAEWFRGVGTEADPGSALVTVSGSVPAPAVYEVALGVGLEEVLAHAGVALDRVQAVLIGGYFGTWVPAHLVPSVTLERRIGCGVLGVLPAGPCGLHEAARITRWLAGQTAGQCGPCAFGLPAIAAAMDAVAGGEQSGAAERDLRRWLGMVKGRGACKHPDGAARFVESSLDVFAQEVELHRRRPCRKHDGVFPVPAPGGWR